MVDHFERLMEGMRTGSLRGQQKQINTLRREMTTYRQALERVREKLISEGEIYQIVDHALSQFEEDDDGHPSDDSE